MSNFKEAVRVYKFTDARLIEIALEKIAFAQRDATELLTKGITATWVSDLNDLVLAFGALPSDEVELGEQQEATGEKDTDADTLRDKLKDMRSSAARAFGDKSSKYNQFGLKGLDDCNDSELLRVAMVAHGVAITYATELAAKGYSATDNTTLQTMITTYVGGLQNQSMEIGSRDNAQENRVLKGNEIYNLLENELCEAAKSYWRTRSAAKYNDYLVYNNEAGTPLEQTIDFNVPALTRTTLTERPYSATRYFTVTNNTATTLHLYLSNDGTTVLGTALTINPSATVSGVSSDLAPSGNKFVLENMAPLITATGSFVYLF